MSWTKFVIFIFFILAFSLFLHPLDEDGDFFHHLNTGKFIIENKTFPNLDQWTFTAKNLPWVAYSWGSGLIFYEIFKNFGPMGISILVSLIACFTFFLLYLLLRSYKISKKICFLSILLCIGPVLTRWPNRPEILGYPLLILLLLIDKLKEDKPKMVLLFPLIIIVWANIYGSSVILGIFIILLLLLKQFIKDQFRLNNKLYTFYLASFFAILASYFNGYGFNTIFYFWKIRQISHYEGEWLGILDTLKKALLTTLSTLL